MWPRPQDKKGVIYKIYSIYVYCYVSSSMHVLFYFYQKQLLDFNNPQDRVAAVALW